MAQKKTTGQGFSRTLSFEEALSSALDDLKWQASHPDEQAHAKVSDIVVELGGIAGGRTLIVKVVLT
jgi:hypothetical protein